LHDTHFPSPFQWPWLPNEIFSRGFSFHCHENLSLPSPLQ
jgi:hypothetical protein